MKKIQKKVLSLVFMLFIGGAGFVSSQEPPDLKDLENEFSFDLELRDFVQANPKERSEMIQQKQFVVLEGSLASISVLDPDPDNLYVQTELINGKWEGLDEVEMFKGFVIFMDKAFADRFPRRVPRNPGPEVVTANSHVLVLGYLYGYTEEDEKGLAYPIFIGRKIRVIP